MQTSLTSRKSWSAQSCCINRAGQIHVSKMICSSARRSEQQYPATTCIWTRPTPDKDENWIKPSYIPGPIEPSITPSRRDEGPLYAPVPEFKPAELPEQAKELPSGPKMPERRPDPIPAGNPKKEAPPGKEDKREAPPPKTDEKSK